jgi:uncharacterized oxidoreductase
MPTIDPSHLKTFAHELLSAGGATDTEAERVASSLVGANLRGHDSHGVMRIPFYVDMLQKGEVKSNAEFEVINESGAILAADGHWGFGQVQAHRLLERLIEKTSEQGVGLGTMRQSSHIGRLGEYLEAAAEQNLVSMVMVNTHGAARRVAPPGGKSPRLGTNPLAIGCPNEKTPLILDFSTSATAEGKVRVKQIAGQHCPDGWLIDSEGKPTTDPASLYADPPGCILPMGGAQAYKGFGLGLMIDIFCGALSGGLVAREEAITPKGNCVFMMTIDPARLGGLAHFQQETASLAQFVRDCPRVEGVDRITLPGDPERMVMEGRLAQGVPFDAGNWKKLVEFGESLSVEAPPV